MRDITVHMDDGAIITCPFGTRIEELAPRFAPQDSPVVAAKANNAIVSLGMRLEVNTRLSPVPLFSQQGSMVYRRSLAFLLAKAAHEVLPDHSLQIGHSLGYGYYYTFSDDHVPGKKELSALAERMHKLVAEDLPLRYYSLSYADACELFAESAQEDTYLLLEHINAYSVSVNECQGFTDLAVAPLVPRSSILTAFEIMPYENGFLLRFPATHNRGVIEPFVDSPRIFSVYKEYKMWGRSVGVNSVGQLNRRISEGEIKEFIQISEAFQNKKLAEIADRVYQNRDRAKIVLIAGPSSSGKTTTAKRLSIFLRVMGLEPLAISLDDYYLGAEAAPRNEKGEPDFECLEALDVPYFNQQLLELLDGREVEIPVFDFKIGARRPLANAREEARHRIKLGPRSVLVVEGIHGLNDALSYQVPRENKFKMYVSALTQLNLDDHNRIPTSDNRLVRRMVRDHNFRNYGAGKTIKMWPNVQAGEKKHIFPFQDSADVAFNSALDYELSVLKVYAEPLLRSVKPTMEEYAEASRILAFLDNFSPIPSFMVPNQSILREFIGGSEFKY